MQLQQKPLLVEPTESPEIVEFDLESKLRKIREQKAALEAEEKALEVRLQKARFLVELKLLAHRYPEVKEAEELIDKLENTVNEVENEQIQDFDSSSEKREEMTETVENDNKERVETDNQPIEYRKNPQQKKIAVSLNRNLNSDYRIVQLRSSLKTSEQEQYKIAQADSDETIAIATVTDQTNWRWEDTDSSDDETRTHVEIACSQTEQELGEKLCPNFSFSWQPEEQSTENQKKNGNLTTGRMLMRPK